LALKKQNFAEGEIVIFDEACVYKRGEYWQFRLWLPKENKYARKSLRTRSESTAVERGKAAYLEIYGNLQQGKSYFSITTKEERTYERSQRSEAVMQRVWLYGWDAERFVGKR
jgi:hypothetical protein